MNRSTIEAALIVAVTSGLVVTAALPGDLTDAVSGALSLRASEIGTHVFGEPEAGAHVLAAHEIETLVLAASEARIRALAGDLRAAAPATRAVSSQAVETLDLGDGPVAIYNLAGTVEVVDGAGSEVRVEVERQGGDGGELRVEVDRIRGREALRVVYPSDRIVYREADGNLDVNVRVDDDGTFYDGEDGPGGWLSSLFQDDRVEIRDSGRGLEAWAHVRVIVPPGSDVQTYLAVGDTRIEGVDADLRVETGRGSVDARDTRGSLVIDTGSGPVTLIGVDGEVDVDTGSGSVDVADVVGDVLVDTGSGSVELDGVEGAVTIDTGSGSVEVSRIAGAALSIDTGSGSVEGGDVAVRSVNVDTGSGSVRLDEVSAGSVVVDAGSGRVSLGILGDTESVAVDTGSGGVSIAFGGDVGDVDVDTGSGSVTLSLSGSAGARMVLEAGGRADVSPGLPFEVIESRRDGYLEGRLGDGDGRVHVETGSGSVRVREI